MISIKKKELKFEAKNGPKSKQCSRFEASTFFLAKNPLFLVESDAQTGFGETSQCLCLKFEVTENTEISRN